MRWLVALATASILSLTACGSDDAPMLTPVGDAADAADGGQGDGDIASPGDTVGADEAGDDGAASDPASPAAAALCAAGPPTELATVADSSLEEISGLAIDGRRRRGPHPRPRARRHRYAFRPELITSAAPTGWPMPCGGR